MREYLVTIVVPTYHHEKYIRETIESIRRQTMFSDCFVIVSDDCSTDRTFEIAQEAGSDENIHVRRNPKNLGIMPHYQYLVEQVVTPYIALLEGDDIWLNNRRLELMLKMLGHYPSMGMCFSACIIDFESSGRRCAHPKWNDGRHRLIDIIDLINDNPIATFSNCIYKTPHLKSALASGGTHIGYDWLCNMKIAVDAEIGFFAEPSTLYRVHSLGQWSRLRQVERDEAVRKSLESLLRFAPPDLHEFINASIRGRP
jgi:glycosyltransferase involved in cell wall biosynthesis